MLFVIKAVIKYTFNLLFATISFLPASQLNLKINFLYQKLMQGLRKELLMKSLNEFHFNCLLIDKK